MNAAMTFALALAAGLALGALHFGALWLTLASLPRARLPGLLAAVSLFARLAVLLAGLYLTARWGGWLALAGALAGVVIARSALLRRLAPGASRQGDSK